jgi:Zn-dependent M28 family amino/carboxypeptidase
MQEGGRSVRLVLGLTGLLNSRSRRPTPPVPLPEVLAGSRDPLSLGRLLAGRRNRRRESAVRDYLGTRGVPFERRRFAGLEGSGENLSLEIGSGDRTLVLVAHHDAVPGSPGANDNAAAVGILLSLLERLPALVPPGLRVRLLFTGAEERAYLGARAYVRDVAQTGVIGVLSLELCGIGDSLVVWDAEGETPFLAAIRQALEAGGRRLDETYHVVGRIPVFGSDHRAFAAIGIPAYGLTVVPSEEADALRRFVLDPRGIARKLLSPKPRPFDTYHTARDSLETLEVSALSAATQALEALIVLGAR